MFEAARIVALIVAASACFRPRYVLGLVVILALLILDAPSMLMPNVVVDPGFEAQQRGLRDPSNSDFEIQQVRVRCPATRISRASRSDL
jgi:hypothetical protein